MEKWAWALMGPPPVVPDSTQVPKVLHTLVSPTLSSYDLHCHTTVIRQPLRFLTSKLCTMAHYFSGESN